MANDKRRHGFRDNYFQDHSRKIVLGENGNPKVEYVYEGIYHTLNASDRQWRLSKLLFPLLTAAGVICLVSAMMTEVPGNHIKDLAMLQAISLLLFFGMGVGAFSRMTAPRHMTRWEYRMGVATLREFSLLVMLSLGALLADELISALLGRITFDAANGALWLKLAACFALVLVQYRLVKKETYLEQVSDDLPHGIDITNDFQAMP